MRVGKLKADISEVIRAREVEAVDFLAIEPAHLQSLKSAGSRTLAAAALLLISGKNWLKSAISWHEFEHVTAPSIHERMPRGIKKTIKQLLQGRPEFGGPLLGLRNQLIRPPLRSQCLMTGRASHPR